MINKLFYSRNIEEFIDVAPKDNAHLFKSLLDFERRYFSEQEFEEICTEPSLCDEFITNLPEMEPMSTLLGLHYIQNSKETILKTHSTSDFVLFNEELEDLSSITRVPIYDFSHDAICPWGTDEERGIKTH